MQNPMKPLKVLSLAIAVAACGDARANEAADDEFARDLKLASSTLDLAGPGIDPALLTSLETDPSATKTPATTLKRGSGDRAVQSRTPTVQAAPVEEIAAVEEALEEVETMAEAPAPEIIDEPVAVAPRPAPVPVVDANDDGGEYGTGSRGGIFGGVVIRGGGVDGDNCELHRRPSGRRGGPVYIPNVPAPTYPTGGGIQIGRRIPQSAIPERRIPVGTSRGLGARIRGR